jgi:hypothetical protein
MYDNYSFDFLISYCNSICTFLQHERRCRIERTKNTMLKLDFQMHFDVYVRVFRHLIFVTFIYSVVDLVSFANSGHGEITLCA